MLCLCMILSSNSKLILYFPFKIGSCNFYQLSYHQLLHCKNIMKLRFYRNVFIFINFLHNVYFQVNEGYTLPSELAEVYPQPFIDFYVKNFDARCAGTDEMVRLVIGNLKVTLRCCCTLFKLCSKLGK